MKRLSSLLLACTACTGFSLGENTPGGDDWVDPPPPLEGEHLLGAIAVEPDEDQLWVVHEEMRAGARRAFLAAVDPTSGTTHDIADVTTSTDRRVMFADGNRMLFMAQSGGTESLTLFDTTTRTPIAQTTKPTWYWGTRTAPSGRAVVVADNADPKAPLHVIDLATLQHQVLAHDGDHIEAMWNHDSDVLLALSVTESANAPPRAKLLRYDLTTHDFRQPLPAPTTLWQLDGYGWDLLFSFTWIGISPDDRWAVFPLIKYSGTEQDAEHVLLILDQTTGGVKLAPGRGPVGFTRDSRSIVSYGVRQTEEQVHEDLWLIDPSTLATTVRPTSYPLVSFAPMRHSDHVVAVHAFGGTTLEIHDLARSGARTVTMASASLADFVTKPGHVWMESTGTVTDLDLATASVTSVALPDPAGNINIRPSFDQAVIAAATRAAIYRVDMTTRQLVGAPITLPRPFARPETSERTVANERRVPLAPASPRLTSRAAHDGDAITLDP